MSVDLNVSQPVFAVALFSAVVVIAATTIGFSIKTVVLGTYPVRDQNLGIAFELTLVKVFIKKHILAILSYVWKKAEDKLSPGEIKFYNDYVTVAKSVSNSIFILIISTITILCYIPWELYKIKAIDIPDVILLPVTLLLLIWQIILFGTEKRIYEGRVPTRTVAHAREHVSERTRSAPLNTDQTKPIHKRVNHNVFEDYLAQNEEHDELVARDRARVEEAWRNSRYKDIFDLTGPDKTSK